MRPNAIGRNNWLFVVSEQAGHRAAILTSLVASCKANLVEPWAYLKDVFTRLAHNPSGDSLANLLPDRWLQNNPTITGKSQKPEKTSECRPSGAYLFKGST